ncbi:MAG: methionine synthase [Motilibacteraceae bacterium]
MTEPRLALPAGAASGVGSLPGTDPREAVRLVVGELPDLPHLPELPGRGAGADLVGRTAALLVDLHVDLQPAGWRLVDRPGRDENRALAMLREDLDALEEHTQGLTGPVKVQLAGPWTLAATLDLPRGERAVSDPGAARDLAASLAEAAAAHVAEVRRRVPGADVVLQLDEPAIPGVLAGALKTISGFGRIRAVEEPVAEQALAAVVQAAGAPVIVHCCAADPPLDLFRRAGAAGLSVDVRLLDVGRASPLDEAFGEAVEAGLSLWVGAVPAVVPAGARPSGPAATVAGVRRLWSRLGFDPGVLAASVVVTPTCGLAGASPAGAREAMRVAREAARTLVEDPIDDSGEHE